ncbi:MAG: tyrosine-protein phosphatase [Erysipelotrichaceae bacterium]|nr:tyrosine-protein phosphatase [Erysipelotrichaceae bacterium]
MKIDERFADALNFRDLGGLKTVDGHELRKGFFYRGAGLGYFNEKELAEFEKLHVKTIMDLRSRSEIDALPDPPVKGAKTIEHSGLIVKGSEDIDWSPAGMAKIGGEAMEQLDKITDYYKNIAFGNEAFKIMIKEVIKGETPLYFHCATGKDRTGVAAMILLGILDVKQEEIRRDYLLSNTFRKKILEESLEKVADRSKEHPEIALLIRLQDGVAERTFDIVTDSIRERYGDFDTYFRKEYGLSLEDREELKSRYVE